ncbi:MAG: hypothetical protein WDN24_19420 [Sphingomonas sp.]
MIRRTGRLDPGLADRLSLLARDAGGDLLRALADQIGRAPQDLVPLERRHIAPDLEALLRRVQRRAQLGFLGKAQGADLQAGRRVVDRAGARARRRPPPTIDQKGLGKIIHHSPRQ